MELGPDDVRRITLRAQGFIGASARKGGVTAMLRRVGGVQLDTISVLARSHELVAYARLGAIPRDRIERAYWHPSHPATFEYWAHAACVLPIGEWPYYAFRRRAFRAQGQRWHQVSPQACQEVLARLAAEGPMTATQLGGAKGGGPWWDWSEVKIAAEWLLDIGEVVCVRRTGWRRVYDLPERVLPAALLGTEPADEECVRHLVGVTARALGVATHADLIDYHRLQRLLNGRRAASDARIELAVHAQRGSVRMRERIERRRRSIERNGRGDRRVLADGAPDYAATEAKTSDPVRIRAHAVLLLQERARGHRIVHMPLRIRGS